jgi:hypothetical protein
MNSMDVRCMLEAWERGAAQTPVERALTLLQITVPHRSSDELAALSIGGRDAQLLALRQQLFGPKVECLTRCRQCGDAIELKFSLQQIRAAHAEPGSSFVVTIEGESFRCRVPTSEDLLALRVETDMCSAQARLLQRCLLDRPAHDLESLSADRVRALIDHIAEHDPQADVLLDIVCPSCEQAVQASFEIDGYLWSEVDAWARQLLADIHTLAGAYGWSEAQVLSLSPQRRRAYLDLIAC